MHIEMLQENEKGKGVPSTGHSMCQGPGVCDRALHLQGRACCHDATSSPCLGFISPHFGDHSSPNLKSVGLRWADPTFLAPGVHT